MDYLISLFFVLAGTTNALLSKSIDKRGLNAPFIQTFIMFIGEILCLVVYKSITFRDRQQTSQSEINKFLLLIPTTFDIISTTLSFNALLLIPVSTYQILKSINIPIIITFSYFFLNKEIKKYEILGSVLILIGLVVAGLSEYNFSENENANVTGNTNNSKSIIGSLMIVLASFAHGSQSVYEEYLFSNYELHPLFVVGTEGIFGIIITTIILLCITLQNNNYLTVIYDQLENDHILMTFMTLSIFATSFVNFFGLYLTKKVSSRYKCILDTFRVILVWCLSFAFGLETSLSMIKVCGFMISSVGVLVYNKILHIDSIASLNSRMNDNSLQERLIL